MVHSTKQRLYQRTTYCEAAESCHDDSEPLLRIPATEHPSYWHLRRAGFLKCLPRKGKTNYLGALTFQS